MRWRTYQPSHPRRDMPLRMILPQLGSQRIHNTPMTSPTLLLMRVLVILLAEEEQMLEGRPNWRPHPTDRSNPDLIFSAHSSRYPLRPLTRDPASPAICQTFPALPPSAPLAGAMIRPSRRRRRHSQPAAHATHQPRHAPAIREICSKLPPPLPVPLIYLT